MNYTEIRERNITELVNLIKEGKSFKPWWCRGYADEIKERLMGDDVALSRFNSLEL